MALGAATAPAGAADIDYSQVARNIIPSGQQGSIPIPDGATAQAQMYNALTPLFDHVSNADLFSDFKSEQFGLGDEGPGTIEPVPFPGVTIVRDRYDVPHVTALTHDGGVWAAGWIAAEDRGLLLQEARDNSRWPRSTFRGVADAGALAGVGGLTAIGLIENLKDFQPSAQTEAVLSRQTQVLENAGPEGRDVLSDIDEFITGINAYLAIHSPSTPKWTRNDVYALNALKDQFFGEGGGREAQDSEFLGGLEHRLGVKKGYSVFNDLRQNVNNGSPTTVDGTFNYDHTPSPGRPAVSCWTAAASTPPRRYRRRRRPGSAGSSPAPTRPTS